MKSYKYYLAEYIDRLKAHYMESCSNDGKNNMRLPELIRFKFSKGEVVITLPWTNPLLHDT